MNASTEFGHSVTDNQLNKTKSTQNDYDSKAVVLFSSVSKRANVAQLQVNTNLNESPLDFLINEAQYYGVHHNISQSDDFTSYQTAHMFPHFVGDVDIISNSTNIKKLFKIPFSGNSVSMIVHRIENTLLIDNYDVDDNLITIKDDRAWLNNIFNSHNLESSHLKGDYFTKNKSFKVIQEETLVSKFLHHSIGDSIDCDENNQLQYEKLLPLSPTWLTTVSLPNLAQDDKYPTKLINHRMYNQYMLWTFEGLQFLLGSNLAIFNGDNNSQLSLRLRDMSKPMNALTGIDYWLDNLVCNVNELLMCNHLNGIIKNNKMVLTEDIPYLKGSKFLPNDIKVTAKNVISFLKSNATNIGHTYWLLKEKNSDVLKLYDLTFLNSDTICQNLFTVPTAMLLYCVVQNAKHNQNNGIPSSLNSNQILLVNCLKLLNETKYPEIIVSVCYLLSDIFIPINTHVRFTNLEDLFFVYSLVPDNNAKEKYSFLYENGVCSIDVNKLLSKENEEYPKFEKLKSKPAVLSVETRCKNALYCVGHGLTIINYEKSPDVQVVNEKNAEEVVVLVTPVNGKTRREKNRRGKKKNIAVVKNNNETVLNTQHSLECFCSKTYIWDKAISFFYKARLAFSILAEQNYLAFRFGKALKNFRFAYRCQMFIFTINGDKNQFGYLLESISVCCLLICINWVCLNQYIDEMKAPNDCYDSVIKGFLEIDCEACNQSKAHIFIPDDISTKFYMLSSVESCYKKFVEFKMRDYFKSELYQTLICKVYLQYTTTALQAMSKTINEKSEVMYLNMLGVTSTLKQTLKNSINIVKSFASKNDLAVLYMNMGNWYSYNSHLNSIFKMDPDMTPAKSLEYFNKAKEWQLKSTKLLISDNRSNVGLWIKVSYTLFLAAFDYGTTNQSMVYEGPDTITDDKEKNVLSKLNSVFKFSDLVNETEYLPLYRLRIAQLYERIAIVYLCRLKNNKVMSERKKQLTFRDCVNNYNLSYNTFIKTSEPVESLFVIVTLLMVDELAFEDTTSVQGKIKMLVSVKNTLQKSVPVLQTLLNTNDISEMEMRIRNEKIFHLLNKVQSTLKIIINGVMGRNAGLTEKLKAIYLNSLMKNDEENETSHLLRIVTSIIDLAKCMT